MRADDRQLNNESVGPQPRRDCSDYVRSREAIVTLVDAGLTASQTDVATHTGAEHGE